jgi:ABC-type transporter MlaC component
LIKTIYKLADSNSSSSIILKDVDIKDNIYIVKSIISDKKSSANLYWKVIDTGSSFKIIDVIVENTSYFVTKKSEFNKILRKNRGSLEALIIEIQKI